jgi:cytochrome c peroxidase
MWRNNRNNIQGSFTPLLFFILILLFSCNKKSEEIVAKEEFKLTLPKHFPTPSYDLSKNPVTKEGFELGKMLFMDGMLSKDGTVSCASCHNTAFAFTQHGHALSHGIENRQTKRNSKPIQNLAWKKSFGWDGGVFNLDLFAIVPLTNPVEMHEQLGNVLEKLRASEKYPPLFKKVFGSDEITTDHFLKALSQFQLFCVSANSPYDKYLTGKGTLSSTEIEGLKLFDSKCSTCHSGVLQTDNSFRNNGLPIGNPTDLGREEISNDTLDRRKFIVPSLRNLKYTFPYMHDGRFFTLKEVLNHYKKGVVSSSTLDSTLISNGSIGIALTDEEIEKIIIFLNTLNDEEFVSNEMIQVF